MRVSAVFKWFFFAFILAFEAGMATDYPSDSAEIVVVTDTIISEQILFLSQNCPSADLSSLENAFKDNDSVAVSTQISIIFDCLADSTEAKTNLALGFFDYFKEKAISDDAAKISLWLAGHFAAGTTKDSADAWLQSAFIYIQSSKLPAEQQVSMFETGERIAVNAENYESAIDFFAKKTDLLHQLEQNDHSIRQISNQSANLSPAESEPLRSEKIKSIAHKRSALIRLNNQISEKQAELGQRQDELILLAQQQSQLTAQMDSTKRKTEVVSEINHEFETIRRIRNDEAGEEKMYGIFGFAILLLICIPSVYIGGRRTWLVHTNLKTYSEQLSDISVKVRSRESLADLGQLSQNVARQINLPIATIERISSELLPLLENIDPVLDNKTQLAKINIEKKAIETIFEEANSAERVVRTMLIHSSSKTESASHNLNELISDCLLLFNQPSIEYAEGAKDLIIQVNRPAFQRIFLSILNHAMDEILAAQKKQPSLPKLIRVVSNSSDNNAIIRITHNGALKTRFIDETLLPLINSDAGIVTENIDPGKQIRTIVLSYPLR